MPRTARRVFPDIPHHVVQRGNRRERVFFGDEDYSVYLKWLGEYCGQHGVQVLAYCLMTNHVHIVAVPPTEKAFEQVFRCLNTRYAQRINASRDLTGRLWQGRYFSSALGDGHFWNALRYVERNPVRAGMVRRAQDHRWSSAQAHCGQRTDALLTTGEQWRDLLGEVIDWASWLAECDPPDSLELLRGNTRNNWPCGSDAFVQELEQRTGTVLHRRRALRS